MAENTQVCSICDQNHVTKSSAYWCSECEQAFCSDCKLYHGSLKLFKRHVPIPISDYQTLAPSFASINSYCTEHEEKYQMFCQSHDSLLCIDCIEKHSKCNNVIPLSKMIGNIKTSEKFIETEQSLTDIDNNILRIEESLTQNQRSFKDQEEIILSTISRVRKEINEHLDKIEKGMKNEVSELQNKHLHDMEIVLKKLTDTKQQNAERKLQLENIRKHVSDLQTFIGLRQITSEVTADESDIQSIVENGSLDKITIEFSIDESIKSIRNNFCCFGTVRIKKSPCDLSLVKQKEKQAQLVGVKSKSINDIKVNLKQTVNTNGLSIRGCDILPDGTMVFSDYHSSKDCLIIINSECKHLFNVSLKPCYAFDVTCIDDKTVAVTSSKVLHSGVNIIDIQNRKILKFIAKNDPCHGITTWKGSLVYCVQGKGIEMMDVDGTKTTMIVECDLPGSSYIVEYSDKLFYTNYKTKTVTCCDMKGNTIWTFKDDTVLDNPQGISVDKNEHVYVDNTRNNSVIVLSANGQQSRQILSKENGLNSPSALHFDRSRKQLLVANSTNNAQLFELFL